MWFKIGDTSGGAERIFFNSRDGNATNLRFIVETNGTLTAGYKDGSSILSTTSSSAVDDGLWHNAVFTTTSSAQVLYIDGEQVATTSNTFDNGASSTVATTVGAQPANNLYADVDVDEFAIWDTVLDGDAIRALYNAGLPTPVTTKTGAYDIYRDNLKAYYKMGDATVPAADGTSNLLFDQTSPGVGLELLTNGDYETGDLTGWSVNNTGGQIVEVAKNSLGSNALHIVSDGTFAQATQTVTSLTAGTVAQLSFDYENVRSGGGMQAVVNGVIYSVTFVPGSGSFTQYFVSDGNDTISIKRNGAPEFYVDNVSVKEVNGHTGTITGATIQTEAPKQIYALPPVANTKSLNFSTDDYLQTQVDATAQPNNESRYYSFWAKASNTGASARMPIFSHGNGTTGAFFFHFSSSQPKLFMATNVSQNWVDNSAQDDGEWHHWTVKIKYNDITGCELWCDGVKQTKGTTTNSGSMNTYSSGITLGSTLASGHYFNGSIDEFSIHEDLDDEAIRALYNRGRPIDISKSQGAYDVSDKALHWWRMGDASQDGNADGTNGIIFQGLQAEGSEEVTNGDFSDNSVPDTWNGSAAVNLAGWTSGGATFTADAHFVITDGKCRLISDGTNTVINSGTTVAGRTYQYSIDLLDVTSGGLTLIGGGQVLEANANSVGTYTGFYTATSATSAISINRQSGVTDFTFDNVSVKQVRGQYTGPELVKADADLYNESSWFAYSTNVATFPNGTSARFTKPTSGGSSAGGRIYFRGGTGNRALTTDLETGCVYKLEFDFLTDDSDAFPRYHDGSAYTFLPAGSGTKVFYFAYSGSTSTMLNAGNLSADKFVQFSNLSLTKIGGAAVMTNMDPASDIQTDTPY
jgi:hypothetical protein